MCLSVHCVTVQCTKICSTQALTIINNNIEIIKK